MKGIDELDVDTYYGAYTRSVKTSESAGELRVFALGYIDHRTTVLKTDNRPAAVRAADLDKIEIATWGADYVHVFNTPSAGNFDFLVWGVVQTGSWGNLSQHAGAFVGEAGWQPPVKVLKPWLSAGYSYGSGDGNPNDKRHGTFFQVLPTPRQYARFPFYNMMNNEDLYGTLNLQPTIEAVICAAKRTRCGWPTPPICGIPAEVHFSPRRLVIRAAPAMASAAWATSGISAPTTNLQTPSARLFIMAMPGARV